MLELFPSRYFHVGADEVPHDAWQTSPAATEVVLDANAPVGVTPTLWRSPDLLSWIPVPNFQVHTTNSTFRLTDPAPPAGPVLYQIRW